MTDPTQRFSSRVTNYVKYRPSYPAAIIDLLAAECGLTPDSIVADVGSGTHAPMLAELAAIFEEHQQNGEIVFE